ncbi:MAG TPA: hypothetical protein VGP95_01385 [Gemmatimonadaceae bacterium]|nr:hypothetical protein [Gemmatimonadaceae bacterium]
MRDEDRGLVSLLVGDGRSLLVLTGLALLFSGGFALFLAARQEFLPHDIRYLGMSAEALCALGGCRVAAFMFHDRVAFGGTLLAVGTLYLWLAALPLRRGEPWAWWAFVVSGAAGFLSFLAYLGYGYLDDWHAIATTLLLPIFIAGLWRTSRLVTREHGSLPPAAVLLATGFVLPWRSKAGLGKACLMLTSVGMVAAGVVIVGVGMTRVFVPQDLEFIGTSATELVRVNPHLVPLIAHDRAGFGGGLISSGLLVGMCVWCATPSRSRWQALGVAGALGFGCAIGVHFAVGYRNTEHLLPAVIGALLFAVGMALSLEPANRSVFRPTD